MDCSRDQFLSGSGFAQDQDRGIGGSHFLHRLQNPSKRLGGADNLLKHERLIELLAKSDVLIPRSLFISLSLVDIDTRRIPTHDASLLIPKRVVLNEEPSILPVFP